MTAWVGRLFGPAQPPAGRDIEFAVHGDALYLRAQDEREQRVALSELTLRYTGFNGGHLELAWRDAAGAWACHVIDPAAIAALRAQWPRERMPLPAALRADTRRAVWPWTMLALFIALPLMLLALLVLQQDRLVDFIAARISPQLERQMGAASLADIEARTPFITHGTEYEALTSVARRLSGEADSAYRFHLADDAIVNAYALPGGDIIVNRGLLRATRAPTELAGVLAHEMAHIKLRHSLKSMIRGAGWSMLWTLVTGDASATLITQAAAGLLTLKFSRDAEREADEQGYALLVERHIDPHGMVDFFVTLAKQQDAAPPALLSTHPTNAARVADLRTRLAQLPADCCQPLSIDGPWPPP